MEPFSEVKVSIHYNKLPLDGGMTRIMNLHELESSGVNQLLKADAIEMAIMKVINTAADAKTKREGIY